uniref:PWWP domain-containing protein n=1 Tax=Daphnia galeata TaxID=27404 RepID=A0A8J2WJQ8_9CRUS|nr:unnamed protein product [Daphnia galeata]
MSETALKLGDLVWLIANPPKDLKRISKPSGKTASCVFFFGTDNFAWIEDFNIKPYHEYKEQFTKACKSRAFLDACQAIEKHIVNPTCKRRAGAGVSLMITRVMKDFDKLKDETKEKGQPKESFRGIIKRTTKECTNGERKRRNISESGSDLDPLQAGKKTHAVTPTIEKSRDTSVIQTITPLLVKAALRVTSDTQGEERSKLHDRSLAFSALHHGLRNGQKPLKFRSSGYRPWNRTTRKAILNRVKDKFEGQINMEQEKTRGRENPIGNSVFKEIVFSNQLKITG